MGQRVWAAALLSGTEMGHVTFILNTLYYRTISIGSIFFNGFFQCIFLKILVLNMQYYKTLQIKIVL